MGDAIWILIPLAPFLLGGFAIWSKHQQKMIEKQSEMTAERPRNMPRRPNGWNSGCACSNASLPTRELTWRTRSKSCATPR